MYLDITQQPMCPILERNFTVSVFISVNHQRLLISYCLLKSPHFPIPYLLNPCYTLPVSPQSSPQNGRHEHDHAGDQSIHRHRLHRHHPTMPCRSNNIWLLSQYGRQCLLPRPVRHSMRCKCRPGYQIQDVDLYDRSGAWIAHRGYRYVPVPNLGKFKNTIF